MLTRRYRRILSWLAVTIWPACAGSAMGDQILFDHRSNNYDAPVFYSTTGNTAVPARAPLVTVQVDHEVHLASLGFQGVLYKDLDGPLGEGLKPLANWTWDTVEAWGIHVAGWNVAPEEVGYGNAVFHSAIGAHAFGYSGPMNISGPAARYDVGDWIEVLPTSHPYVSEMIYHFGTPITLGPGLWSFSMATDVTGIMTVFGLPGAVGYSDGGQDYAPRFIDWDHDLVMTPLGSYPDVSGRYTRFSAFGTITDLEAVPEPSSIGMGVLAIVLSCGAIAKSHRGST